MRNSLYLFSQASLKLSVLIFPVLIKMISSKYDIYFKNGILACWKIRIRKINWENYNIETFKTPSTLMNSFRSSPGIGSSVMIVKTGFVFNWVSPA